MLKCTSSQGLCSLGYGCAKTAQLNFKSKLGVGVNVKNVHDNYMKSNLSTL